MKTIRIKILVLAISALLGFSACSESINVEEHESKMQQAQAAEQYSRDSLEQIYLATLDEIDKNLDLIRDREGVLIIGANSNADVGVSKKDQIVNNISMINTLLAENKNKLAKLEKSLVSYKKGKKEFLNAINQAKERIVVQEAEIDELKKQLTDHEFKIAELNKELDEKEMQAASLSEQNNTLQKNLNKVYFASGTFKELKEHKILVKEGGILGVGKVKKLNAKVDKDKFIELDQRENTVLPLAGKNPKIITSHPADSYTVSATGDDMAQLVIKDPESFWSSSKYLVVEHR